MAQSFANMSRMCHTMFLIDDTRAGTHATLMFHALPTRKVAEAGNRSPLLKPLLERCLCLHAEDRPSSAEALRALEGLRADPCVYHPAGHGAGVLADRWFKVRGSMAESRLYCAGPLILLNLARRIRVGHGRAHVRVRQGLMPPLPHTLLCCHR